jgi:sortase A
VKNLRIYGLASAAALIALATLPALPATQAAITEPQPLETVPVAKATDLAVEKAQRPPVRMDKESALEKLSLKKLTIERPVPEEPPTTPEPVPEPEKESKNRPQAGVTGVSALPGSTRKVPAQEALRQETPTHKAPKQQATPQNAARDRSQAPITKPVDTRLQLSVPRLGLKNVTVGNSSKQTFLDREGIMHLSGTGFPVERGSNTYIAGHAGDFYRSRIPNVFRNLKNLRRGDLITLRDATGKAYNYRVYERLVVSRKDVWVTEPVAGKKIVSLQTCFPAPTFQKNLIVRGELVG